ncbi:energy transducer TonB [Flavobacterium sp.]|uniref:energy transducer TonB n=1 Tax=Flavobacterium sp. TaxID=239 RepID=UPI00286A71A9|nr:energy transducer TonB [Flavobacterium sp.]
MSRLSIYANSWIDLVFEGKNQAYGAFQLRQKSDETTLLAFCLGISFVAMLATIPMLISSFSPNHETEVLDPVFPTIQITNFKPNKPQTPVKLALPVTKKSADDETKKEGLIDPEIVKPIDANPDIAKNNEHPVKNNPDAGDNTGKGNNPDTRITTPTGTTQPTTTPTIPEDVLNTMITVDKRPEFPGGIVAFYNYIGENFEKLEVEETISVVVSFVIEKDGSMTDIKVLRSAAPSIDREAIRVLKSLRTKWKPGIKDGKPVRTEYKLPIKVKNS